MLVHVKTPHIEIKIQGEVPDNLLTVLRKDFSTDLEIYEEEAIDITKTEWYNSIDLTPGDYIRIDRENKGLTLKQLGEVLGEKSRQYVSDLEHGRRSVSLNAAKKLSEVFDRPVDRYV